MTTKVHATADKTMPASYREQHMTRGDMLAIVLLAAAGALGVTTAACSDSLSNKTDIVLRRAVPFDSLFAKVREFVLEEPAIAPISMIQYFRPLEGDRFLVVDRNQNKVRIHAGDGSLIRIFGRRGDGPGEFKAPLAGLLDEQGYLYVTEASPRVTRFKQDLAFDTVFRVPAHAVIHIEPLDSILAMGIVVDLEVEKCLLLSKDGTLLGRFHKAHPLLWKVPYWGSFFWESLAVGRDRIFVANGCCYPLYMYDTQGNFTRTFGTPPGSWVDASRPESGAFTGTSGTLRMQEWLRSFTIIRQIDLYGDSLLVVTHARYVPDVPDFGRKEDIGLDLYDLDGKKLFEDMPVPGRILRAADYLYVLLAEPPEGWRVGVYGLRER
jgi:hypothetical protein